MNRKEAHKLVDQLFDANEVITAIEVNGGDEAKTKELPKDKRVIRTRSSGDRVYLLDEIKKTRQWITAAPILDSLGFSMADVKEIDDAELLGYQLSSPVYKAK